LFGCSRRLRCHALEEAGAQAAVGAGLACGRLPGAQAIIATAAARITEDEATTRVIELDGYSLRIS
jgi:hypothetical protein